MTSLKRTVIIFKSESDSTDLYNEVLREHSFNPIFIPTLSFGFKNLDKLEAKLRHPDNYAGIIFTSPRCIEAVCEALALQELPGGWKMLHNYSVGEVTHNLAMSSLQQLFTHGKQTGNARNLADFIIDTFDGSRDFPFLLPCGNLQQDTLLSKLISAGFHVDACEVYETKCSPNLKSSMDKALKEENIEFLCFFSPSGVNCTADYFKENNINLEQYKLIAIGPSTRKAIEEKGWKVFRTAERPTVDALVRVLINPEESRENAIQNAPS